MGKILGEPGGLSMGSMNRRPAPPQAEQSKKEALVFGKRPPQQPVQKHAPAAAVSGMTTEQAKPVFQAKQAAPQPQAESGEKDDLMKGFVGQLRNMVGGFAVLSEEVLKKNLKLAAGDGMTYDDRTISFECIDYMVSNLAYIFMGLVMDDNFKNSFIEALNLEISLDDQTPEMRAQIRKETSDPNGNKYHSNGSLILGVTTFMPHIAAALHVKMQAGFDALDPYAAEFDAEVRKMPNERRIELGFIFSNFMYLIRAISHNDVFMSYIITVIEKVKENL